MNPHKLKPPLNLNLYNLKIAFELPTVHVAMMLPPLPMPAHGKMRYKGFAKPAFRRLASKKSVGGRAQIISEVIASGQVLLCFIRVAGHWLVGL